MTEKTEVDNIILKRLGEIRERMDTMDTRLNAIEMRLIGIEGGAKRICEAMAAIRSA